MGHTRGVGRLLQHKNQLPEQIMLQQESAAVSTLLSFLSLNDIAMLLATSKKLKQSILSDATWQWRMSKLFPSIHRSILDDAALDQTETDIEYVGAEETKVGQEEQEEGLELSQVPGVNWFNEFSLEFRTHYGDLNDAQKASLVAAAEGDVDTINVQIKGGILSRERLLVDSGFSLNHFCVALRANQQSLLDFIFHKLVLPFYVSDEETDTLSYDDHHLDLRKTDEGGRLLLHWAVICRQIDLLSNIIPIAKANGWLDQVASVHEVPRGRENFSALGYAVQDDGDTTTFEMLLAAGAKANLGLVAGASNAGYSVECLKQLLDAVEDVNAPIGGTTLLRGCVLTNQVELVRLLLARDDVDKGVGPGGISLLHRAVSSKSIAMVRMVLEQTDVDVNLIYDGRTALQIAAEWGCVDIMQLLLSRDDVENTPSEDGSTLLHYAAQSDSIEAVNLALEQGIDIDARNELGQTALHVAARYNKPFNAKRLLSKGADVNVVGHAPHRLVEYTPLQAAILCRSQNVTQVLLDHGTITDHMRNDAFDRVFHRGDPDLIYAAIARGAKVGFMQMRTIKHIVPRDKLKQALIEGYIYRRRQDTRRWKNRLNLGYSRETKLTQAQGYLIAMKSDPNRPEVATSLRNNSGALRWGELGRICRM